MRKDVLGEPEFFLDFIYTAFYAENLAGLNAVRLEFTTLPTTRSVIAVAVAGARRIPSR
jgi:hypothetical protein